MTIIIINTVGGGVEMFVCDFIADFYNQTWAVVSYIFFGSVVVSCLYIYWAAMVGQIAKGYKQAAIVALMWVCILIGVHVYLTQAFHMPILVPPIGSPFFTEFMHVIQFLASMAVVFLFGFLCIVMVLKNVAGEYGKHVMSALIFLAILFFLHQFIVGQFGIPLIFPPTLW